jgi:anionic cell wall polymer biosynthesis LytR-Cps2A-Psr (LCP) family protein
MDMHYTSKSQNYTIDLEKGKQVLNGNQAVQFLRFRSGYAEGDGGRMNAQKDFLTEAFKQSIGIGLPKVAKVVFENVEKNISGQLALQIVAKAAGMKSSDLSTNILPGDYRFENGASFFFEDEDKTYELVDGIYKKSVELNEKAAAEEEK